MKYTTEMYDLAIEITRLKSLKKRPGTKIYYAEKRLARLIAEGTTKNERKLLPQTRSASKKSDTLYSSSNTPNRAYVLSHETQDLIRAILALDPLRKG